MNRMSSQKPQTDTPSSSPLPSASEEPSVKDSGLGGWWSSLFKDKPQNGSATDTLAGIIEDHQNIDGVIDADQRILLDNILALRDRTVYEVMVPRADIVAVDVSVTLEGLIKVMTTGGHSRIPVYRESLDDAVGMAHIKDVLACRGDEVFELTKILRRVLVVSPSMQVLELLLEMRVTRCHMALVVDEYGGIDGLVTIEDLVEEIVGEIEDEHDRHNEPNLIKRSDGSFDADARVVVSTLEEQVGTILTDEEREDIETLGGLVFALAGRVPIRGELVRHDAGLEFEVIEADPRRIKQLRIRVETGETPDDTPKESAA